MYELGIIYIKDLLFEGNIATLIQLRAMFDQSISAMQYNLLVTAIPREWHRKIHRATSEEKNSEKAAKYSVLMEKTKWSSIVYSELLVKQDVTEKLAIAWSERLNIRVTPDEIKIAFRSINKYVDIVKYRSFQYKLLHGAIMLNDRLIYCGISQTNLCCMCNLVKEKTKHFFFECAKVEHLLKKIEEYILVRYNEQLTFSIKSVILGSVSENEYNYLNLIVTVIKQHIYVKKCGGGKINHKSVIDEIVFIHEIEYHNAIISNKYGKYNKRWPDKISRDSEECTTQDMIMDI